MTKVLGKHTVKAGTHFEYVSNTQNNWGYWGGFYSYDNYSPSPTGNHSTLRRPGNAAYSRYMVGYGKRRLAVSPD